MVWGEGGSNNTLIRPRDLSGCGGGNHDREDGPGSSTAYPGRIRQLWQEPRVQGPSNGGSGKERQAGTSEDRQEVAHLVELGITQAER